MDEILFYYTEASTRKTKKPKQNNQNSKHSLYTNNLFKNYYLKWDHC